MVGMRTALTVFKTTTSSDTMSIAAVSDDKSAGAARAVEAGEGLAHVVVGGDLAQLNHGTKHDAAGWRCTRGRGRRIA